MPTRPEPSFDPAGMRWARWADREIQDQRSNLERLLNSQGNVNSNQNSTLNMLVDRLGNVESSINDLLNNAIQNIQIDAGQVVSGTIDDNRLGVISASKIGGGSLNIPGSGNFGSSIGVGGDATVNGNVYVPNSTTATVQYTVGYINGDGRLSRGASSIRFKEDVVDAPLLGDLFGVPFREFSMIGGDGERKLGYIAEELVGTDLERFVVWEGASSNGSDSTEMIPFSIDFIPLLMAQNQSLHSDLLDTNAKLDEALARIAALEEN